MSAPYDVVVATGGIGSGMFLALHGDRTLGREESRAATLLDQRDYCKQHIVCHYVQRLLGSGVRVVPIGKVGDDAPGRDAVAEMRAVGMDTSFVTVAPRPTLFSVCFLYPDGDGGNITTAGSASDCVGPDDIRRADRVFADHHNSGIAVALPEVPLEARAALLDRATDAGFRRVATFVSQEWDRVLDTGLLTKVDLLAVNLDEAAALAGTPAEGVSPADVLAALLLRLRSVNPGLSLVMTAGRRGSWAWDGREVSHATALDVEVASTAGAGDAHLAGLVVATARGLPLADANRYAALVSGLKVTSRHTINPDVTAERVREAAQSGGWSLPAALPG
ncbi:MAG: PfkB family carbohydrate kinase [Micromonospora sp.]